MRTFLTAMFACVLFASAAVAADKVAVPNRLDKVKAGEWVLMQGTSGDNLHVKNKMTVTAVKDGVISIRRERLAEDGSVEETREFDVKIERAASRSKRIQDIASSIEKEQIFVKDQMMDVVAITWSGDSKEDEQAKREFKVWVSDKLPVFGLAKNWSSDHNFPSSEIVDYGF